MARSWPVLVIAIAIALAACSAFVPSPEPTCDTAQFNAPPTLSCEVR